MMSQIKRSPQEIRAIQKQIEVYQSFFSKAIFQITSIAPVRIIVPINGCISDIVHELEPEWQAKVDRITAEYEIVMKGLFYDKYPDLFKEQSNDN